MSCQAVIARLQRAGHRRESARRAPAYDRAHRAAAAAGPDGPALERPRNRGLRRARHVGARNRRTRVRPRCRRRGRRSRIGARSRRVGRRRRAPQVGHALGRRVHSVQIPASARLERGILTRAPIQAARSAGRTLVSLSRFTLGSPSSGGSRGSRGFETGRCASDEDDIGAARARLVDCGRPRVDTAQLQQAHERTT